MANNTNSIPNRDGSEIVPSEGVQASGSAQDAVKNYLASALGMDAESNNRW